MANKKINIGGYEITENSRPYMIAEIGINHNGDIDIAKKLMDAANATGWHSVKYQKRTPELAVPEAQKSQPKSTPWGDMTYLEYKYRVEFEKPQY
ncbi:MAG: N-acetylneuraminate synthase, partial [Lachnospiraceae bacterium]|nr:N-acetylneuraminate synthase [Lachnospiraceae bacterium]